MKLSDKDAATSALSLAYFIIGIHLGEFSIKDYPGYPYAKTPDMWEAWDMVILASHYLDGDGLDEADELTRAKLERYAELERSRRA